MLHDVGGQSMVNGIKPAPTQMYSHRLIQSVNINEKGAEGQKRITIAGTIKIFRLNPQEGKAKLSQACLVYAPQDLTRL